MSNGIVLGRGFDVVGAVRRKKKNVVPVPHWMRATTSQGVSRPQEEMDYLPFTPFILSAGGTGPLFGSLLTRPQRPFRGERPVLSAVAGGANVSFNVAIDPAIFVGAVMVGASRGSVPLTTFAPDSFGVRLSFPPMGQGTDVDIPVRLLSGTTATTVTGTLIGRAMR